MNELRLRTPEGVTFSFLLASPISRMLALWVDIAAVAAISQTLGVCLGWLGLFSPDFAQAAMILSYFATSILYGILLEYACGGQTLGKKLFRLRVMDQQGLRLTFTQVTLRNFLRLVDMLPLFYLAGGIVCLLSPRFQRLGDIVANTVVIRQPRSATPNLNAVEFSKFNSLKAYPHLTARLRQRLTPEASALLLEALLRRDEFEPSARIELFEELAGYCSSLVAFPPEAMESSADEQFVRNVVETIYDTGTLKP